VPPPTRHEEHGEARQPQHLHGRRTGQLTDGARHGRQGVGATAGDPLHDRLVDRSEAQTEPGAGDLVDDEHHQHPDGDHQPVGAAPVQPARQGRGLAGGPAARTVRGRWGRGGRGAGGRHDVVTGQTPAARGGMVAVVQRGRRGARRGALLLLCLALAACTGARQGAQPQVDEGIRVTSFDFVESRLLGELYAAALEDAGLPVDRLLGLGPREVVIPALEQGHVDVVPEYTGSVLRFLTGSAPGTDGPARVALDAALDQRGLRALEPAPGQDQNGVVVTAETAAADELRSVSDLRRVAPGMSFGGPPECPERPLCLPGLEQEYGLRFASFVPFDSRAATAESLLAGQIDVGMLETVDAYLADGRLRLLADDAGLQPPENVVPVLRAQVLVENGRRLRDALDALSATLTTDALMQLHREVILEGRAMNDVAAEWVRTHRP
jgi:osmoprotectant transport system substrate-binding protein